MKYYPLPLLMLLCISAKAQNNTFSKKGFHFSGGINFAHAIPNIIGDIPEPWGIGVEVQPEYRISKHFALYASTGYTNFFNKEYEYDPNTIKSYYKTYNVGFTPVLAGAKVYINSTFFIGTKAGIAFINRSDNTTFLRNYPKEKTAFNIQPQIGFAKNKLQGNFGVNVFANDDVHLSLSFLYNLK